MCAVDHNTDDCPPSSGAFKKHIDGGGKKQEAIQLKIKFKCSNCDEKSEVHVLSSLEKQNGVSHKEHPCEVKNPKPF